MASNMEERIMNVDYELCDETELVNIVENILGQNCELSDDCKNKLVEIFCKIDLDKYLGEAVLKILFSKTSLGNDQLQKLILWFFSCYRRKAHLCSYLLSWFIALLEDNRVSEMVGTFYTSFHKTLAHTEPALVGATCKLLLELAVPRRVSQSCISLTYTFYTLHNNNKNIAALLKRYKELVPGALGDVKLPNTANWPKWKSVTNLSNSTCPNTSSLEIVGSEIQNPCYPESSKEMVKLSSIQSVQELGRYWKKLVLPYNSISLLTCPGEFGHLLVGLGMVPLLPFHLAQIQTSSTIQHLTVLQRHSFSYPQAVSSTMPNFLLTWDGVSMRDQVLSLVPWCFFNTYEELFLNILSPLIRHFTIADVEFKIQLLDAFVRLLTNLMGVEGGLSLDGRTKFLRKFSALISGLIDYSLVFHQLTNPRLLAFALNFYHKISFLEIKYYLLCWTIIRPSVFYGCLTSSNIFIINQLCSLLVRYRDVVVPHLITNGLLESFSKEYEFFKSISRVVRSLMWKGEGSELENVQEDEMMWLESQFNLSDYLNVGMHQAVAPLALLLSRKACKSVPKSDEEWLVFFESFAEGMAKFFNSTSVVQN